MPLSAMIFSQSIGSGALRSFICFVGAWIYFIFIFKKILGVLDIYFHMAEKMFLEGINTPCSSTQCHKLPFASFLC